MLTPRERVRLSLEHKKPDRIPLGYRVTPEINEALKKYLNIPNDNELMKRLGIDYRYVFPNYIGPKDMHWDFGIDAPGKDVWGVERKYLKSAIGGYNEISKYPLKEIEKIEELDEYPWPKIEWFDFKSIENQIKTLEDEDEYWISMTFSGSVFEFSWYMRGMEQFLMDLLINPDFANKIMEKVSTFFIELTTETLKAANGRIDMVRCGDDIGGQTGMLISPVLWRKMIKPWFKKFFLKFHKLGVKTWYHSDGSITPVIEDLIEIGIDILNPLQFNAQNFPSKKLLKEKYGNRLSFNGGMDVQTILPFGTISEIKKETIELIEVLGENGGFILESSHCIQPDTKPENIMAMYDTALKYKY